MNESTIETWESTVGTTMWLIRLDPRGREYHERYGGKVGARVVLRTEERELNQIKTADAAWDVFTNGFLVPVRQTAAQESLRTPNMLTEADITALFAKNANAFKAAISKIDSVPILEKLLTHARTIEAKASQITALEDALAPYKPKKMGSVAGVKDEEMPTIREREQRLLQGKAL
jgi:hypothetical protein